MTAGQQTLFAGQRPGPKILTLGLVCLLVGLFCLRIPLVRDRYFDPDETQHLQVAYLISRGWVPHRDFFEHHQFLLHFLLLPLIRRDDPMGSLFAARILMLAIAAAITVLTYRIGRTTAGPGVGALAAAGLLSNYNFLAKTLEIRPDNLAIVWLLLAVIGFNAALRRDRAADWFRAGAASGLGLISTQKAIFPLLGVVLFAAFVRLRQRADGRNNRKKIVRRIAAGGGGILLVISSYLLYFLLTGSLAGMIRESIIFNSAYARLFSPFEWLQPIVLFNPIFVFWSLAGIFSALATLFRDGRRNPEKHLICCAVLGGIAGAFIIPVPFRQYYALFMPLAYILAATAIIGFLEFLWNADLKVRATAGLVIILPALLPVFIRHLAGYSYNRTLEDTGFWIGFLAGALFLGYLFSLLAPRKIGRRAAGLALLAAVIIRPVNLAIHSYRHTNHDFRDLLTLVHRETGSADRVLDGRSGLGLFRFPAYYHYFLNQGLVVTRGPETIGSELLSVLRSRPPAVIIRGNAFDLLPAPLSDFVDANYAILPGTRSRSMRFRIYRRKD